MPPIISGDSAFYWYMHLETALLCNYQNMLYPLIIKLYQFFHKGATPAEFLLVQCLLSSCNVILFFCLGKKVHSAKLGIIAAIIATFWVPFIEYSSCVALTETLAVTCAVVIMLKLADCIMLHDRKSFVQLGICIGFAFFVKAAFYLWFLSVLFIFVFYSIFRKNVLRQTCFLILSFYMVTSVYYIRNYYFYGEFSDANNGFEVNISAMNPYPGIQPDAKLRTSKPSELIDPSKIGTGTVFFLPVVTLAKVEHKRKETIDRDEEWYKRQRFLFLKARTERFLKKLTGYTPPTEEIDYTRYRPANDDPMAFYAWQYRRKLEGKEWIKKAAEKNKEMLFSGDLYGNCLLKAWDIVTYPSFGRFTYYYYYHYSGTKYSEHYISPLIIFFEHYAMLVLIFFGFLMFCAKEKRIPSDAMLAIASLSFMYIAGAVIVTVPEPRYIFPILPFLFMVASYGLIRLTEALYLRVGRNH